MVDVVDVDVEVDVEVEVDADDVLVVELDDVVGVVTGGIVIWVTQ